MAERLFAIVLRPEAGWEALRGGYPRDAARPAKRELRACAVPVTSWSDAHGRFGTQVISVVTGIDKAQREVAALGRQRQAPLAVGRRARVVVARS